MPKKPTPKEAATKEHPFASVLRAGVPICAFETPDPQATVIACQKAMNGRAVPCLQHDVIRGLRPLTKEAESIAAEIGDAMETQNLPQCLALIHDKLDQRAAFFIHTANKGIEDWTCAQAIWNLRDKFKALGSTLVLLGPSVKLPAELANDVPLFEEPIPTEEQINSRIDSIVADAQKSLPEFPAPKPDDKARVSDTLTGYLSMFAIEQSLALSVTKTGLDLRRLWDLKVASLKNTAGLEISQPTSNFGDLAGCTGIKTFLTRLISGRERFRGVYFLDEAEKMTAGGSGDLSGTSQAMIEQFLYWTEAKRVLGVLLLGVPGAGKSWTAQCTAGEAGVPLLRGSLSSVKGSLVGQSEANMKNMLRTVDSVTAGKTLMIATCNSLEGLSPEIMARFKLGVFFYSYPDAVESAALWKLYLDKYELPPKQPSPKVCANWVGREIESCCHRAWLFGCDIEEAAESIVPVCRANKDKMDALRRSVSGRFLSAAQTGVYEYSELTKATVVESTRRFGS